MQTIVECVPNFSEGRDAAKVEAIIKALLDGPEVYLLDREMDADHNRSVITLVGSHGRIGEAALRGMGRAAELIDLNHHQGAHPRLGATDVVPFVPVAGVTLEDCVRIAESVAEQAWLRFRIPTYLYEAAARRPERKNLENIRRGQFEGVREEVLTNPDRLPDFGPKFGEGGLHPTAGATVVGARKFLVAYNINLATPEVSIAKGIAKKIRASSGGFACVKAMGVDLAARGLAQVSMNLTDYETTSIGTVFDAVAREAAAQGVSVAASEIVGLIPQRALEEAAVHYLKVENYHPDLIVENRLAAVLQSAIGNRQSAIPPLHALAEPFIDAVAADTPAPGGGSVSALAGALAAALGEMVCRLTLKKKSYAQHHEAVQASLAKLTGLRARLMEAIDRDAASYDAVVAAFKLPRQSGATAEEQAARAKAIEEASKIAAAVPLETAELAVEVARVVKELQTITVPQAASDLNVALGLAAAARAGAVENVRANLPSISDRQWIAGIEAKLGALE
ncbi:MAG TPA: glutamate formimidoyltransferase [Terriglobia bacterium]|nr:glutamate formimidoyltransferase [Terriglobia bacterium]